MSEEQTWAAYGTLTTAIPGAGSAPTLKNLSSGALVTGAEIDNTSGLVRLTDWQLKCKVQNQPSQCPVVALYLAPAVDGADYETGPTGSLYNAPDYVGCFVLRSALDVASPVVTYHSLRGVVLPPGKFKPVIVMVGASFTNVDNENILSYREYGVSQ